MGIDFSNGPVVKPNPSVGHSPAAKRELIPPQSPFIQAKATSPTLTATNAPTPRTEGATLFGLGFPPGIQEEILSPIKARELALKKLA